MGTHTDKRVLTTTKRISHSSSFVSFFFGAPNPLLDRVPRPFENPTGDSRCSYY